MPWEYHADLDKPGLNSGQPWSAADDRDLRWGLDHGRSLDDTARFLSRSRPEILRRMTGLGIA
jgi:hypothetical protein